tara:strand:+ start:815 stop:1120 length:306 start_codon:yes stop_codon:yes gene_type:complete
MTKIERKNAEILYNLISDALFEWHDIKDNSIDDEDVIVPIVFKGFLAQHYAHFFRREPMIIDKYLRSFKEMILAKFKQEEEEEQMKKIGENDFPLTQQAVA